MKNILLIEKLDLSWNKQTNFNKLGPFAQGFPNSVKVVGWMGNLHGGFFDQVAGI